VKLSHAVEALSSFAKLGFSAPPSTEDCPALYEELVAKREWLKTAPPKEKKKPAAPAAAASADPPKKEKDAPPTADTALEIEGMTSQADADKIEAAIKALDGIISVTMNLAKKSAKMVGSPGFPTSDQMIEAVVAAGFTATEKRLAGGMFKFDPDEVDVNGGDATADDLMDAFGFGDMGEGGDDAGEEEEAEAEETAVEEAVQEAPAPAPAPVAAAAAPNGSQDLITIKATSETTVKVGLHLGGEVAPAAPPKKEKDAPPTTDTALEIEGMTSQADADKVEAAIKALDGIISVTMNLEKKSAKMVGSPGFPTSDQMIEAVVAAGFTATEKRLAGGMFKFDPVEVDVNGGTATVDDLMDAFGF
jgi:copper chaperone CopZ